MPAFAERLVGQPDHLGVGRRPGGPDQLDPDLGKLAQPARAGVAFITEHRARAAHSPGQGGHSARFGISPHDAGGQLRPQTDPRRTPSHQLEELGNDARAALSFVQIGEFEDRRPHRLVARPRKAVEQLPLDRRQPRIVGRQPVARAAHQADRPLGDRARPQVVPDPLTPALMSRPLPA